jgi:hypothetical protein
MNNIILPDDVLEYINSHAAAMVIQRVWKRFSLYSHAKHKRWSDVRLHLKTIGAWPSMHTYSMVRREWRTEPESWLSTNNLLDIKREAAMGLWGAAWIHSFS